MQGKPAATTSVSAGSCCTAATSGISVMPGKCAFSTCMVPWEELFDLNWGEMCTAFSVVIQGT